MRLSLRHLILLTLLTLTLGGGAAIGYMSYSSAREALVSQAIRLTGLVAENRRQSLLRTLTRERDRLARMAQVAAARCPAVADPDTIDACFRRSAESFASFEGATSARLLRPNKPPILVGGWHHDDHVPAGQLIAIHRDENGKSSYVMTATSGTVTLSVELPITAIQHIFADHTGLGAYGETFLIDSSGVPLTPMLDPDAAARAAPGPWSGCVAGASGESLGPDYRGIDVIRGFRTMAEIGHGCIVAHVAQTEAFAPVATLGRRLAITMVLIAVAGICLSVITADRIGEPIRRLQASARRLQSGVPDPTLEPAGPAEVRDLTEAFQAMARSVRSSHESLAAANRLKDEFLATLSHELRTPLNAIVGWTALLRTTQPDGRRLAHGLDVIDRNARAQAELISDLLDMSRVIRGTLRLQPIDLDLADVVRAAIDTMRPAADAKGIVLDVRLIPCAMLGDAARLQQVVWNLLSNAVKFTPAGGSITVVLTRASAGAEIVVSDTGPGIHPDFLPHVFEPFRQGDTGPTRAHGGLGLGLAIVRRLVELHGGQVRAEGGPGGVGATFVVELPSAVVVDGPLPIAGGTAGPERATVFGGLHVLVVEDHDDTREVLTRVLEAHGARVDAAASASAAMTAFRADPPDVLVADIGLPEEDGYALMRRIRALAPSDGGAVPAVALTAYARPEDRAEGAAAGFNAYLAKPVDDATLLASIATCLQAASIAPRS